MSRSVNSTSGSSGNAMLQTLASFIPDSLSSYYTPIFVLSGLAAAAFLRPRKKSSIETYYSVHPVPIPREDPKLPNRNEENVISLMQQKMPSVFGPGAEFKSVPWLPTGDAHTIYTSLANFENVDPIEYERFHMKFADGGLSGIDVSPPSSIKPFQPGEPILFIMHGLTGGSHESYIRAMLTVLAAPKEQGGLGMRAVVQNSRGCNGLPIVTPKLYNAGTTDDVRAAILWVSKTFPGSPIYGIGFSLGANCITKYVGEEGDACPFSGCVSVANPYDFFASNRHIETYNFMTKYIYNYALGGALQALLSRHKDIFFNHPDSPLPADVLKTYLEERAVGIRQFDEVITRRVFDYVNAYDYYAHNSSARFIEGIRVPYLGLNALDDPITGVHTLPIIQAKMNPWILLVRTEAGGHLGWFETAPDGGLGRWYVKPLREWFGALLEYGMKPRPVVQFVEEDGWTVQVDKPHIRFKPVESKSVPPSDPVQMKDVKKPVPFITRMVGKMFTGW